MKPKHFNCCNCSTEVDYADVGGNPYKDGGKPICDECHRRLYEIDCPLCEDYFPNKTPTPKKYYFVVMPDDVKIAGLPSGIYKGKAYPIWTSDMFTTTIVESNVELVKPLGKLILNNGEHTNQICPSCFQKYTNDKWVECKGKIILIDALIEETRTHFYKVIKRHKGDMKYFTAIFRPTVETLQRRRRLLYNKINKNSPPIKIIYPVI